MKRNYFIIFISLILYFLSNPVFAENSSPDFAREKRMADEIVDAILDGEPIKLKAGEHEFLAIDTEAEGDEKGAVIILHGRGFHPDWADAINPLRVGLAKKGWRTLSLQMPVLEKSAKYYDYVPIFPTARPRIDAGIAYLEKAGVKNIVLLGHSCGAHMAMDWITANGDAGINAYIGVGMGATDYKQPMKKYFPLEYMVVPVLDIFGEQEYPAVLKMAPERKAKIKKAGNPKSAQKIVPGANHYFTDQGDALVETVASWLDTLK
ncbi:MAG TPA: DUF3530 family protein [Chromatiales bacterium]|nr:DUF3530 family protein [Thiotrichales bacterium]HIP68127.1 DUF3530 family protein [Chromatiales bacterium]